MPVQHTLIKESLRAMMGELTSEASISSTNTSHFFLALSFHSLRPDEDRNEDTLWSVILWMNTSDTKHDARINKLWAILSYGYTFAQMYLEGINLTLLTLHACCSGLVVKNYIVHISHLRKQTSIKTSSKLHVCTCMQEDSYTQTKLISTIIDITNKHLCLYLIVVCMWTIQLESSIVSCNKTRLLLKNNCFNHIMAMAALALDFNYPLPQYSYWTIPSGDTPQLWPL